MKNKVTSINYQKLLISTVKERYFNLMLGMIVSLLISTFLYKLMVKNFTFKIAFSLPKIQKQSLPKIPNLPAPPNRTYLVKEGDDLWHIAEKFYGSGFNAFDISLANKIDPNSSIEVGQKLIIPNVKRREPTVGDISAASTSQVTYTEGKYVVQPGDSLSLIAFKVYGDLYAWPRILQANNLLYPDMIEVGMVLSIPR